MDAFQKKIAEKGTLVHAGGSGVKKLPFFWFIKRGTYSYPERGQNCDITCHMLTFVFLFHTICSVSWGLTLWKFCIKCNKVVDLNLKCHRGFVNSPLEKWNLSLMLERGGGWWTIFDVSIPLVPFRLGG